MSQQQGWPRSTFLGCPGTELRANILPRAAYEIPHGKVCFSQVNASWWSLSCPMHSSHGLRTHRDFDMRWACTNVPSCGELDSLMSGVFFSYSSLLLLFSYFICTKIPPLITRQRMYESYLVFPKSSLLYNILYNLGYISAVPSLL